MQILKSNFGVFVPTQAWNDACGATFMKYWALVIGSPREKEGVICAPLTKVLSLIHTSPPCAVGTHFFYFIFPLKKYKVCNVLLEHIAVYLYSKVLSIGASR